MHLKNLSYSGTNDRTVVVVETEKGRDGPTLTLMAPGQLSNAQARQLIEAAAKALK